MCCLSSSHLLAVIIITIFIIIMKHEKSSSNIDIFITTYVVLLANFMSFSDLYMCSPELHIPLFEIRYIYRAVVGNWFLIPAMIFLCVRKTRCPAMLADVSAIFTARCIISISK